MTFAALGSHRPDGWVGNWKVGKLGLSVFGFRLSSSGVGHSFASDTGPKPIT